jgi:hypothetical protein
MMSTKVAFLERIDSELADVQARFDEFKAQGKNLTAEDRIRHARQCEVVQQKTDAARAKLTQLDEAQDNVWEELVEGVENVWSDLQSTLEDTVTTFKK